MKKINKKAFTLVEIMVAVSIFSVILISVMGVYIATTQTSYKADADKIVHENIKNIVSDISETIIKNGISWVNSNSYNCQNTETELPKEFSEKWNFILCSGEFKYYLAKKILNNNDFSIANKEDCEKDLDCFLVKQWNIAFRTQPVTNSQVAVKNLDFRVTENNWIKKVTIFMKISPSKKSGVRKSVAEKSTFDFQTTLSERNK